MKNYGIDSDVQKLKEFKFHLLSRSQDKLQLQHSGFQNPPQHNGDDDEEMKNDQDHLNTKSLNQTIKKDKSEEGSQFDTLYQDKEVKNNNISNIN